jgi:hypothetical protein
MSGMSKVKFSVSEFILIAVVTLVVSAKAVEAVMEEFIGINAEIISSGSVVLVVIICVCLLNVIKRQRAVRVQGKSPQD